MGFRQIQQFLHRIAQADAGDLAAADGDQRLGELKTAGIGMRPGIGKAQQTRQTIRRRQHQAHHRGAGQRAEHKQIGQPCAGQKQNHCGHGDHDRGRTEVGFDQQQEAGQCHEEHRPEQPAPAGGELALAACGIAGDIQDQAEPRRLRSLHGERSQIDPAASAVDGMADTRDKHDHQQQQPDTQQREGIRLPHTHRHMQHDKAGHQPHHCEYGLTIEEIHRVVGQPVGDRHRSRAHHDQTDAADQRQRDHKRRIGLYPRQLNALQSADHAASSSTAATKLSPRCT